MDTGQDTDRDPFAEANDVFSGLELDQKATFLITQAVNTTVEAVSTLVDVVVGECTEFFGVQATVSEEEKDTSRDESAEDASPTP